MYFSSWITALAILGALGLQLSFAQVARTRDVEEILASAAKIQKSVFDKFEIDGLSTSNCLINGLKSRNIDILQLKKFSDAIKKGDPKCNTIAHDWQYDFRDFFENDLLQDNPILSATCGKFSSSVWNSVQNGQQLLTHKIATGLLATVQPNVTTPDAITFIESALEIIRNNNFTTFQISATANVFQEIAVEVMNQNRFTPEQNYQVTAMAATQSSVQLIHNFNIFSIINVKTFPEDVVRARDAVIHAITTGNLEACSENGWTTPPDQLLAVITSLTTVSYHHPMAVSIHVLFAHVRMWYFCIHGYQYVPRTINDIVFLLNSFLTIRNPSLLREVFHEFYKIPWQEYTAHMDFAEYCDPRSLMIDIIKAILNNPKSLKICNTILFNYFINAEEDCPHWLKPIFPTNVTENYPLEFLVPIKRPRPVLPETTTTISTSTVRVPLECDEGDVSVINPDSIIEIFDREKFPLIAEILKKNPFPVERVAYNTREGALKQIMGYLIHSGVKYTERELQAMRFAERHLPLNHKKFWQVEYGCDKKKTPVSGNIVVDISCDENEVKSIDPECLIEIFDSTHYPMLVKFVRDHPIQDAAVSVDRYHALTDLLKKSRKNETLSQELAAIFELFLGRYPPINHKGKWAVTWTCVCEIEPEVTTKIPECKMVSVVNQESLIAIINEERITTIKNVIFMEPIFYDDFQGMETRESILKKVLADRQFKLNDDILNLVLPQAIDRMKISWTGMLPPIIDEICEHELKFNITFQPIKEEMPEITVPEPCKTVTVIDQGTLIEIIADEKINVLKNLVFMEPVLYSKYGHLSSREDILRQLLHDRMVKVDDEILNLVVPMALERMQISWRGMLPPVIEEICNQDLVYNIVTTVPPLDDEIVCEGDSIEELGLCGPDEKSEMIVDTISLFDALDESSPRATVIRQKIISFIYPIFLKKTYVKSFVLREILLALRGELAGSRLAYEADQMLVAIRYDGRGMEAVKIKNICVPAKRDCGPGENLTYVIDVKSLVDVFPTDTVLPLFIWDSILTYLVPADSSKTYKKGVILKEILEDILEDVDDLTTRKIVIDLIKAVRHDGPALDNAPLVLECFPNNVVTEPPCDDDEPKPRPIREEDQTSHSNEQLIPPPPVSYDQHRNTSLEKTEKPQEFTTTLIPITTTTPTTTTTTITSPVESSEECEESEEVTTTTTAPVESSEECEESEEVATTTMKTPIESSEECEESEEATTTTTTTKSAIESSEECEESEEVTTTTTTTEPPIESSEECEESEEVTTTTTEPPIESSEECEESEEITTTEAAIELSEECEESEEVMTTTEAVIESSEECEESEEVTTTTTTKAPIESSEECEESEEVTTTTTEAPTTVFIPPTESAKFAQPCLRDQWPLLLKLNLQEKCFDESFMTTTHPVDVIAVSELLSHAEGSSDAKYIVSAKLAGLDTYHSLQTFDWEAYCTRSEFFNALMQHINFKTSLIQRSNEPITITTVCRKQLVDTLPGNRRNKRQVLHRDPTDLELAITTAKDLLRETEALF